MGVPLAGKTGTTNNNFDAWFIGFSSNLVIGVYVGFDNPKTLGKYETGSKAALPIFKNFIREALYKEDFKDFPIPKDIYFAPINYDTGRKTSFDDPKAIIEAFKLDGIKKIENDNFDINTNYDRMIKFRQFY
jgi:Membrane carboxypeptidase/penicillin-binding protein